MGIKELTIGMTINTHNEIPYEVVDIQLDGIWVLRYSGRYNERKVFYANDEAVKYFVLDGEGNQ